MEDLHEDRRNRDQEYSKLRSITFVQPHHPQINDIIGVRQRCGVHSNDIVDFGRTNVSHDNQGKGSLIQMSQYVLYRCGDRVGEGRAEEGREIRLVEGC